MNIQGQYVRLTRMEAVRLRVAGKGPEENSTLFMLMDAADLNKVLMFIKVDHSCEIGTATAKTSEGYALFKSEPTASNFLNVVDKQGDFMGTISENNDGKKLVFTLTPLESRHSQTLKTNISHRLQRPSVQILNPADVEVGTISNHVCATCIEISFQYLLPLEQKFLIIALSLQLSLCLYTLHKQSAPGAFISTRTKNQIEMVASATPPNFKFPVSSMVRFPEKGMVVRAAGYNKKIIYCDIFDISTNKPFLTAECDLSASRGIIAPSKDSTPATRRVLRGSASILNRANETQFTLIGFMDSSESQLFIIVNARQKLLGTHQYGKFFDENAEEIEIVVMEGEQLDNRHGKEFYDDSYKRLATLRPEKSTTVVDFHHRIPSMLGYALILSMALRSHFNEYGYHQKPMPHIEYCYPSRVNNYTGKLFLFQN